jgi:MoxR-like ATPase
MSRTRDIEEAVENHMNPDTNIDAAITDMTDMKISLQAKTVDVSKEAATDGKKTTTDARSSRELAEAVQTVQLRAASKRSRSVNARLGGTDGDAPTGSSGASTSKQPGSKSKKGLAQES